MDRFERLSNWTFHENEKVEVKRDLFEHIDYVLDLGRDDRDLELERRLTRALHKRAGRE